jgi:hypothetical protein
MKAQPELAATEARVFRAYWQDGVLDLLAGSSLVLIGIGWLAGFVLAGVIVPPIAISMWPLLRNRITKPRLGQVRFGAARRFRMRHGLIAVASLGVLLCGFVALHVLRGEASDFLRWIAPGIPALILAALALSAAEALRLVRFVVYAAAFVAVGLAVSAVDADPGWAIVAGGVVVAASGARMLASFLRRFPCLPAEMEE